MQIRKMVMLVWLGVLLQGCVSPKMSEEMEGGKAKLVAGNYQQSFHELLPVAVYGRKEAQYAVGYQYYYGLGVPVDPESGIFWMQKAADQQYQPAIDALKMINGKRPPV